MKLFRDLAPEEEPEFRQWAIDNIERQMIQGSLNHVAPAQIIDDKESKL